MHKRATEGLSVMATIGNSSVRCGPDDIICNGPLESNTQYGVRYTLFSGDQSQEYPFFDEAQFTTGECIYHWQVCTTGECVCLYHW